MVAVPFNLSLRDIPDLMAARGIVLADGTREGLCDGTVALEPRTIGPAVEHPGVVRSTGRVIRARSEFAGFRFPPEVITLAVRWYLRFGLSYRDVEELLAERGVEVDHTTLFRWVVRFTPLFVEAARPCRHTPGDRWFVDETYVKVRGRWRYQAEEK